MPQQQCDHTSVGILVWNNDRLLLIERKKFPFGFAPPAGHVDNAESYKKAAKKELLEEVGLTATRLSLLWEGDKDNPCRRPGGTWHAWKLYEATTKGTIKPSQDETKSVGWFTKYEVQTLAERTEGLTARNAPESDWRKKPGLEPVWSEWLREYLLKK